MIDLQIIAISIVLIEPTKMTFFPVGYGKSPSCNGCNRVEFMKSVLDNVIGDSVKPVIVSPSMSGGWSLPFIKEYQGIFYEYLLIEV